MFINKFVQKCQYWYALLDQSIPLVTVRSVVSLLTKQLPSGATKHWILYKLKVWKASAPELGFKLRQFVIFLSFCHSIQQPFNVLLLLLICNQAKHCRAKGQNKALLFSVIFAWVSIVCHYFFKLISGKPQLTSTEKIMKKYTNKKLYKTLF